MSRVSRPTTDGRDTWMTAQRYGSCEGPVKGYAILIASKVTREHAISCRKGAWAAHSNAQ